MQINYAAERPSICRLDFYVIIVQTPSSTQGLLLFHTLWPFSITNAVTIRFRRDQTKKLRLITKSYNFLKILSASRGMSVTV